MSVVRIDARDAGAVIDLLQTAAQRLRTAEGRRGATQWIPARGSLLATGDLHDNLAHLLDAYQAEGMTPAPERLVGEILQLARAGL